MRFWKKTCLNNRPFLRAVSVASAILLAVPFVPLSVSAAPSRFDAALIALHGSQTPSIQHLRAIQDLIGTFHQARPVRHYEGPFSNTAWNKKPGEPPDVIEVKAEDLQSEDGLWLQVMYLERLVQWARDQHYLEDRANVLVAKDENWFERALLAAPVVLRLTQVDGSEHELNRMRYVLDQRLFGINIQYPSRAVEKPVSYAYLPGIPTDRERLQRELSDFKVGNPDATRLYADRLISLIRQIVGQEEGPLDSRQYVISQLHSEIELPYKTIPVGELMSSELSLPLVYYRLRGKQLTNYTGLKPAERQMAMSGRKYYERPEEVRGKSVIIFDDVWVTGGFVRGEIESALRAGAREVIVVVLVDTGGDLEFEKQASDYWIENPDRFLEVLRDTDPLNHSCIKYLLRLATGQPAQLANMVRQLENDRFHEVLRDMKKFLKVELQDLSYIDFYRQAGFQSWSGAAIPDELLSVEGERQSTRLSLLPELKKQLMQTEALQNEPFNAAKAMEVFPSASLAMIEAYRAGYRQIDFTDREAWSRLTLDEMEEILKAAEILGMPLVGSLARSPGTPLTVSEAMQLLGNGQLSPKAVLLDKDGTLTRRRLPEEKVSPVISPENLQAWGSVMLLAPSGIVSGANFDEIRRGMLDQLPMTLVPNALGYHRGGWWRFNDGQWEVQNRALSADEAKQIEGILAEAQARFSLPAEPRVENKGSLVQMVIRHPKGRDFESELKVEEYRSFINFLEAVCALRGVKLVHNFPVIWFVRETKEEYVLKLAHESGALPSEVLYIGDEFDGNDNPVLATQVISVEVQSPEETGILLRGVTDNLFRQGYQAEADFERTLARTGWENIQTTLEAHGEQFAELNRKWLSQKSSYMQKVEEDVYREVEGLQDQVLYPVLTGFDYILRTGESREEELPYAVYSYGDFRFAVRIVGVQHADSLNPIHQVVLPGGEQVCQLIPLEQVLAIRSRDSYESTYPYREAYSERPFVRSLTHRHPVRAHGRDLIVTAVQGSGTESTTFHVVDLQTLEEFDLRVSRNASEAIFWSWSERFAKLEGPGSLTTTFPRYYSYEESTSSILTEPVMYADTFSNLFLRSGERSTEDVAEAASVIADAAQALAQAFDRGVVCGDVQGTNLLLDMDTRSLRKIIDPRLPANDLVFDVRRDMFKLSELLHRVITDLKPRYTLDELERFVRLEQAIQIPRTDFAARAHGEFLQQLEQIALRGMFAEGPHFDSPAEMTAAIRDVLAKHGREPEKTGNVQEVFGRKASELAMRLVETGETALEAQVSSTQAQESPAATQWRIDLEGNNLKASSSASPAIEATHVLFEDLPSASASESFPSVAKLVEAYRKAAEGA